MRWALRFCRKTWTISRGSRVEVRELEKYSVVLTADVSFSTGGVYVPREERGVPKTLLVIASPPQGDDVSSWQRKWGPMWNFKPVFGLSIWRSPMDAKEMEREANQASKWKKVRRSFLEQQGVKADGSSFAALPYVTESAHTYYSSKIK